MAESFRLELPEPDPDEDPLELESPAKGQPPLAESPASLTPPQRFRQHRAERRAEEASPLPSEPGPEPDADELWTAQQREAERQYSRYSLAEIMFVTALLAVLLTVARFVSLPILAGMLGALVLLGLVVLSIDRRARLAYILWIALLVSYVIVAFWAAVKADG